MSRAFAEGLWDHKQAILRDFTQLIPALEHAFPDLNIVVRPHPSENHEIYHDIAAQCERVAVTSEGNVIPWLLAAKTMVHNGCTTGLEAYVLGVPAISYLATFNEYYDYDFQGLPTKLSYQCFNFEELKDSLTRILSGELGPAAGEEREALAHLVGDENEAERLRDLGMREGAIDDYALVRDAWLQRRNYQIAGDELPVDESLPDYLREDINNPTVPVDALPVLPGD